MLTVRRYSDSLLALLIKGRRPEYRDNHRTEVQLSGNLALSRGPDLSKLTNEQLELLEQLALAASASLPAIAGPADDQSGESAESAEQDSGDTYNPYPV